MPLYLEQKKVIVSEMNRLANDAICTIAADYCHLSVADATALRKTAREKGVKVRVCRNTLAKRAFSDTDLACLSDSLTGQIMLFFANEEPGAAAKLLRDFIKTNDAIEVKALAMDGVLLGSDQLSVVASLPSRDEALAKVAYMAKAPVTQMVRTIKEPVAQFVRALAAVRDKKQDES